MAGKGRKFTFHGAFGSKAKAEAKEKKLKRAFIRRIKVRGQTRFLVLQRRRAG